MLHTDAAQQRPGNPPASAPEASQQKPPRAQKQANPGLPASQRMNSQPGDTTAADQTAGTLDTSHTSLIHDGLTPPPPWNSTPHASTHSTLLKSSNRPMAAARRRQGQQLYAWHGTPSRRPQAAPPFPLTPAGEVIQPKPPALPPEAWPSECNTNKAKQPKRDKVFLNTTHY